MTLTYKDVSEILKIIDASDCEELVLELGGTRLVVRRGGAAGSALPTVASPAAAPRAAPAAAAVAAAPATPAAAQSAPALTPAAVAAGTIAVRAPMVGTFYRKPSPQDPAFVEIGQKVKKGDSLCLIEVMKLYTTIEAPADGVVDSIGPADGTLVEFDQVLFSIRPA